MDEQTLLDKLSPNEDGLVTAVVQNESSNEVLMLAWMNRESLKITIDTGDVTYYSRSRKCLWRKGETSGNTQKLKHISIDCDGDALLIKVIQKGNACHMGKRTCFYTHYEKAKISDE